MICPTLCCRRLNEEAANLDPDGETQEVRRAVKSHHRVSRVAVWAVAAQTAGVQVVEGDREEQMRGGTH